ncbi:MAG: M48 family metalloprotease [Deltaproteobacteria bacterium]|nr:M48 family metalloprotease [Deltaproteobacteria bacterium]
MARIERRVGENRMACVTRSSHGRATTATLGVRAPVDAFDAITAGGGLASLPGIARAHPIPCRLLYFGAVYEKLHGARYGFYPANHPLTQYLNGIARRLVPRRQRPPVIRVTRHDPAVNAFALPHGTIIVSDRLLSLCRYQDEHAALLAHEIRHLRESHHASGVPFGEFSKWFGVQRMNEYESDMLGEHDLPASGYNPYAAALLQYRLAKQGSDGGLAHGSSIDRGLNAVMMLQLIDYGAATETMQPVPDGVRGHVYDSSLSPYDILLAGIEITNSAKQITLVERRRAAGPPTSLATLRLVMAELAQRYGKFHGMQGLRESQAKEDLEILRLITRRLEAYVVGMCPSLAGNNEDARLFVVGTFLAAECGLPLLPAKGGQHYWPVLPLYVALLQDARKVLSVRKYWTKQVVQDLDCVELTLPDRVVELSNSWRDDALPEFLNVFKTTLRRDRRATRAIDCAKLVADAELGRWVAVERQLAQIPPESFATEWQGLVNSALFQALPWLTQSEVVFRGVACSKKSDISSELEFFIDSPATRAILQQIKPHLFAERTCAFFAICPDAIAIEHVLLNILQLTTGARRQELFTACFAEYATHVPGFLDLTKRFDDSGLQIDQLFRESPIRDIVAWSADRDNARYLLYLTYLAQGRMDGMQLRDLLARALLRGRSTAEARELLLAGPLAAGGFSQAFTERWINAELTAPHEIQAACADVVRTAHRSAADATDTVGVAILLEPLMGERTTALGRLQHMERPTADDWQLIYAAGIGGVPSIKDEKDKNQVYALRLYRHSLNVRALFPLSPIVRMALGRNILTGADGLLQGAARRGVLLDHLLRDVALDASTASVAVRQMLYALAGQASLETFYIAIAPVVERRLFSDLPPVVDWDALLMADVAEGAKPTRVRRLADAIISAISLDPVDIRDRLRRFEREESHFKHAVSPLLDTPAALTAPPEVPTRPLQLVVTMANKSGPIAVRGLQVLGQMLPLNPDEVEAFSHVYDDQPAQSKLTASTTLDREWPEWATAVAELLEPIGAGSLFTTFHARMADGTERAVKIRNPNVEFMLRQTYATFERTLSALSQQHGGGYTLALRMLPTLQAWVMNDLRETGFLERDAAFAARYQGFTDGGRYRIRIPQSFGPENRYVRQEEYIHGVNLTKLQALREAGHDLMAIVALLVRHYAQQILQGQVHSDVHPGNFRVTEAGEVAVLDRHWYLDLKPADQEYIMGVFSPVATPTVLGEGTARYFGVEDAALVKQLTGVFANQPNRIAALQETLHLLHGAGIAVPLIPTLLMKNLNGLVDLATKVGFRTLAEPFDYQV